MVCKWIQFYGDYCFTTECGHTQGTNVRPRQKTCFCGKRVERYIQNSYGSCVPVSSVRVKNGIAYYSV